MAQLISNGNRLEYERLGDSADPAVILIAGLALQMIDWPDDFCHMLCEGGYQVIRFDNRDVGRSDKMVAAGMPDMEQLMRDLAAGKPPGVAYDLFDMALDTIGLLDGLGLRKAHIVGMSMGGMIAQIIAASHPDRAASLTSIMSSSGSPGLPPATEEAEEILLKMPESFSRDHIVDLGRRVNRVIGSPGFPWDDRAHRHHLGRTYDRGICLEGNMRQFAAARASDRRNALLSKIAVPALVLHGADDPLILPACGEDTARLIPGAALKIVEGMGHDLSPALCGHLAPIILSHCRQSGGPD